MSFSARSVCALALASFAPVLAFAQAPSPAASPASDAPAPNVPGNASADSSQDAGAEKKTPATGYSYTNKPAKKARHAAVRHERHEPSGPTATLPGFEPRDDGGSRLFVELTQSVPVEERKARGGLTYVLKGAHVRLSNNLNSLVTVHFNTPVSRARLVPHGKDLLFVIDLRSEVTPTWKMQEGPDKTARLTIDFPKSDSDGSRTKPTR